jgi:hypothetical protein
VIMEQGCSRTDCTVAQTRICLLNNDAATCPHRTSSAVNDAIALAVAEAPVLRAPLEKPKFPSSLTLTLEDSHRLMSERYCHVIGVLGAPDAGKTASLVSLYLLLSHSKLHGFDFADSRSIMAFEEISRGTRRWNEGHPPAQMTTHTDLGDGRAAGFMHLRLRRASTGEPFDILVPDLPGEWTTSFMDSGKTDRLEFLKATDTIWLMADGKQLIELETRQYALHRMQLLMQRLAAFLSPRIPPVILVISRSDFGVPDADSLDELEKEARKHGISLKIMHIASFTEKAGAQAGAGIADLISSSIKKQPASKPFWPDSENVTGHRAFLKFRRTGGDA